MHLNMSTYLEYWLDPISGSAPKFPQESEFTLLTIGVNKSVRLKCPAQGSPIPNFR